MNKVDIFKKIPKFKFEEKAIKTNSTEFCKVAESRRSVRVYKEEQIPEDVMKKCLEIALLAPNSSNLQPWEFYWVKNKLKKEKLIEYCLSQPAAATASELIVCVSRPDNWKKNNSKMLALFDEAKKEKHKGAWQYYNKIAPLAYNQGPMGVFGLVKKIIIFLRGLSSPTPRGPASKKDMEIWAQKSTALACQNLMLAFRAFGYDSCPMEGMDSIRVKKLLQLPRKAKICMIISAGKRASNGVYGRRIRFNKKDFIKIIE